MNSLQRQPLNTKLLFRSGAITGLLMMCASAAGNAQNVVSDWNMISANAIVTQGGKGPAPASVFFAYTSIAVYDAVNSIHRKFRPFYYDGWARQDSSDEAAAIAAAHRILVHYFPNQTADLDNKYATALARIRVHSGAKSSGIATGEAAAQALISARMGDGLEASVPYSPGSGPGVWQPTPPGFLPAAAPWMAEMRPFTLIRPSQFLPDGPLPLSSQEWVANYNVTRLFGDLNSAVRTPAQTEIGIFWTDHAPQQYARALTYLVRNYRLDLLDSARLMAMTWTAAADSLIGCFNAKYAFNAWRPVTAIDAGGGNPDLPADAAWSPLGVTPNHPEYPAAHACITAAVSAQIQTFFGTPKVRVVVDSVVFKDGVHTHTFDNTDAWLEEVSWARVYAGFHFLHSLQDGAKIGQQVSQQVNRTAFQPIRHDFRDR